MRNPFELSFECAAFTPFPPVDVVPPSGFPFCSVPPFTSAILVIREPEIVIPDIAAPDVCNCITFNMPADVTVDPVTLVRINPNLTAPTMIFEITRVTDDCCQQIFSVNFQLDIPCMPLSIARSANINHRGTRIALDIHKISASTLDECALMFDMEIPCMPISIPHRENINIEANKLGVTFYRTADADASCMLAFDLEIPCMPIALSHYANINHESNQVALTIYKMASADASCMLAFDLEIPCMPLSVMHDVRIRPTSNDAAVTFYRTATADASCMLAFDLEIPCMPMSVVRNAVINAYTNNLWLTFHRTADDAANCILAMDLEIPCMPLSVAHHEMINPSSNVISLTIHRTVSTYADCVLALDLEIPCMPLSVVYNAGISPTNHIFMSFHRTADTYASCMLVMDMDIPCMPMEVLHDAHINPNGSGVVVSFVKTSDINNSCVLDFMLEIPCMPLDVFASVNMTEDSGSPASFNANLYKSNTAALDMCQLNLDLDVNFPYATCGDLSALVSGTVTQGSSAGSFFVSAYFSGCDLNLHYDLIFPDPSVGCPACEDITLDLAVGGGTTVDIVNPVPLDPACWSIDDIVCLSVDGQQSTLIVSDDGFGSPVLSGATAFEGLDGTYTGTICHGTCVACDPGCSACDTVDILVIDGVFANNGTTTLDPQCWPDGVAVCLSVDGNYFDGTIGRGPGDGSVTVGGSTDLGNNTYTAVMCLGSCPSGKTAIVATKNGYKELNCVEMPEVLFFDVLTISHKGQEHLSRIDPLFIEVCEPGSLKVISAVPAIPVVLGATIRGDVIITRTVTSVQTDVTVMVAGTRKGFSQRRFASRTRQEYINNTDFWNSATATRKK